MILLNLDLDLLYLTNGLHHPILDYVMLVVTSHWFWACFIIGCIGFILARARKDLRLVLILGLAFNFFCTERVANTLKHATERLRPFKDAEVRPHLHVNEEVVESSGKYSLPSAHALNSMGMAVFLILCLRKQHPSITPIALTWAVSTSISRVYLGAHYPSDVALGWTLGSVVGYGNFLLLKYIYNKKLVKAHPKDFRPWRP